ncbi:MAG: transporter substrate-binding domain-containing protein [Deltaproteobacteria bacterium]|nr:transporter substrate-binding domain-containing protein [Deltaproteobacteria bacterium]
MTQKLTILVMLLFMAAPSVPAQEQQPKDTLVIAMSDDFQPFAFLNAEGEPAGLFVDIWRLWAKKTGKQIEFIASSDWKTTLENLKNRKADIHSGLRVSPGRLGWMSGSVPLYEARDSIFYTVKQGKISDMQELSGQTVTAIGGGRQEKFIKTNYPSIQVLGCLTRNEMVTVPQKGKARGFIAISLVGSALIDRMGFSGEFDELDQILYRDNFRAGVLKGNTELLAFVNKGLNAISQQELAAIEARWVPNPAKRFFRKASPFIRLTPAEEAWIKNNKTIRVGMSPIFPPLKFTENGVIKGIELDYLDLLSQYTNTRFKYVISDLQHMDAMLKSGEIDMFLSSYIPERLAHVIFTEPLIDFKQVIVARGDFPFIFGLSALQGKRVATVKGEKLYDKILAPYPEIEALPLDTLEDMFRAVEASKADVLITETYLAGYSINKYPNLKIAGDADLPSEPYMYAVRKDYPKMVQHAD